MRNDYVGSMSIGRWFGVRVRLHISFILVAIFVLFLFMRPPLTDMTAHGWTLIAVWFASVVLHELGHLIAGARLGLLPEVIVLTPVGSRVDTGRVLEPQREVAYALAGPLANVAAWAVSGVALFGLGDVDILNLLHPFDPRKMLVIENVGLSALQMIFWVNWCLLLVNLLPAYPLDGGRVLRALLWHSLGAHRTRVVLTRSTQLAAIGLLLLGWVLGTSRESHPLPAAFPLAVLATWLLFQAKLPMERREEEEHGEELFGYDFSQGYTSLEKKIDPPAPKPGPITRWLKQRREDRERRRLEVEAAEEQRADDILAHLHAHGPESLSPEDRALLARVSARYRARLGSE